MKLGSDPIYDRLVHQFVPRPIRHEADHQAAALLLEELLAREELHPSEAEFVDLLSKLVHAYEEGRYPVDDIHGIEILRLLMDERGLEQRDLLDVFKTKSSVSEVLAGRRELTKGHIEKLAAKFAVSPAVFFPRP